MYQGLVHIFKLTDITFLPCADPPPCNFLRDELVQIIESGDYDNQQQKDSYIRLAMYMRKNVPPEDYLLGMLSTVAPGHAIFQKNWTKPSRPQSGFI